LSSTLSRIAFGGGGGGWRVPPWTGGYSTAGSYETAVAVGPRWADTAEVNVSWVLTWSFWTRVREFFEDEVEVEAEEGEAGVPAWRVTTPGFVGEATREKWRTLRGEVDRPLLKERVGCGKVSDSSGAETA